MDDKIRVNLDKSMWQACKHEHITECKNEKDQTRYLCNDCGFISKSKCLIYSRPCGYLTPTEQWNVGKAQEFRNRETFDIPGVG